jgi:hypothetical protein
MSPRPAPKVRRAKASLMLIFVNAAWALQSFNYGLKYVFRAAELSRSTLHCPKKWLLPKKIKSIEYNIGNGL